MFPSKQFLHLLTTIISCAISLFKILKNIEKQYNIMDFNKIIFIAIKNNNIRIMYYNSSTKIVSYSDTYIPILGWYLFTVYILPILRSVK